MSNDSYLVSFSAFPAIRINTISIINVYILQHRHNLLGVCAQMVSLQDNSISFCFYIAFNFEQIPTNSFVALLFYSNIHKLQQHNVYIEMPFHDFQAQKMKCICKLKHTKQRNQNKIENRANVGEQIESRRKLKKFIWE